MKLIEKLSCNAIFLIIIFFVFIKFLFIFKKPLLSDDIYRYLWEAKVLLKGFNPYILPPSSKKLIFLHDKIYNFINHKNLPSIYPPVMLYFSAIIVKICYSIEFYKFTLFLIDIANFFIIILILHNIQKPLRYSLFYLIHPLTTIEIEWSGHNEVIMIFFILLGILFLLKNRNTLKIVFFTMSVFTKYIYGIFIKDFIKNKKDFFAFIFIAMIFYLPFINDFFRDFFSLKVYLYSWEFNGSLYKILTIFIKNKFMVRIILGILFIFMWIFINVKVKDIFKRFVYLLTALIIVSPTVHPWYGLWLLPFLCFRFELMLYIFLMLLPFSYYVLIDYFKYGIWHENNLICFFIYLPIITFILQLFSRKLKNKKFMKI